MEEFAEEEYEELFDVNIDDDEEDDEGAFITLSFTSLFQDVAARELDKSTFDEEDRAMDDDEEFKPISGVVGDKIDSRDVTAPATFAFWLFETF